MLIIVHEKKHEKPIFQLINKFVIEKKIIIAIKLKKKHELFKKLKHLKIMKIEKKQLVKIILLIIIFIWLMVLTYFVIIQNKALNIQEFWLKELLQNWD